MLSCPIWMRNDSLQSQSVSSGQKDLDVIEHNVPCNLRLFRRCCGDRWLLDTSEGDLGVMDYDADYIEVRSFSLYLVTFLKSPSTVKVSSEERRTRCCSLEQNVFTATHEDYPNRVLERRYGCAPEFRTLINVPSRLTVTTSCERRISPRLYDR